MRTLILIVVMGISLTLHAEPIKPKVDSTTTRMSSSDSLRIDLLRQEIRLLQQYNDRITTSYEWSLGFVALFLVSFLGLTAYLTVRRYDQDKDHLENLLKTGRDADRIELEKQLAAPRTSCTPRGWGGSRATGGHGGGEIQTPARGGARGRHGHGCPQ